MAKKTPLDKLSEAVDKLLTEYQEDVVKDTNELVKQFAKKGAKAVSQNARSHGWGKSTGYDKGWTSQYEEGRFSSQGIIYNKKAPGLPHLLENGHALRGGGRTRSFPHIAPVEEKLSDELYKAVVKAV